MKTTNSIVRQLILDDLYDSADETVLNRGKGYVKRLRGEFLIY